MSAQPQDEPAHLARIVHPEDHKRIARKWYQVSTRMENGVVPPWLVLKKLNELLSVGTDIPEGDPDIDEARLKAIEVFGLSAREVDILDLLEEGLSNTGIGKRLFIAEQTVKFHLTNLYRKLRADNRTHAVRIWNQTQKDCLSS